MQEEIIQSVLDGKDTLALLPTGGGKSLTYQIPVMKRGGIGIVISPLIALMKDQVEGLKKHGISAIAIYAGLTPREVDIELNNCIFGKYKFLYLSPERLASDLVRTRIRKMNVNLLAVDEAHCISQWGFDFRPEYLKIAEIREYVPHAPILALTATATPKVAEDIQKRLTFKQNNIFQDSFKRANLQYMVVKSENKLNKLAEVVKKLNGSGIIYTRTRRETEEITRLLKHQGVNIDYYHAGLDKKERDRRQTAWSKGQLMIMASTNAFGMGIDNAHVRFVIHHEMPESLEGYYQETGRAGRDGEKAQCILFYNNADRYQAEERLEQRFPDFKDIQKVYHGLGNVFNVAINAGKGAAYDFDIRSFSDRVKLGPVEVFNSLKILEENDLIFVTEALTNPSKVKILVNHLELYDFQIKNKRYDGLIKTLLRSYGGVFDNYAPIDEYLIAKREGINGAEVIKQLERLAAMNILEYLPKKDKPQIVFTMPRCDAKNLVLDHQFLRDRRANYEEKLKSVLNYVEQDSTCRMQVLLRYFGENEVDKCGKCDICLQEERESTHGFIELEHKIKEYLTEHAMTLKELVGEFELDEEKDVVDVIRMLLDERVIKKDGDKLIWAKK